MCLQVAMPVVKRYQITVCWARANRDGQGLQSNTYVNGAPYYEWTDGSIDEGAPEAGVINSVLFFKLPLIYNGRWPQVLSYDVRLAKSEFYEFKKK